MKEVFSKKKKTTKKTHTTITKNKKYENKPQHILFKSQSLQR